MSIPKVALPKNNYVYEATVVSVHDGDTCRLLLSLGLDEYRSINMRLYGCNAIELGQPGGIETRDTLAALLPIGSTCIVQSVKIGTALQNDKYGGRYDATITLLDGRKVLEVGTAAGWLAPWDGNGKKPVPAFPFVPTA